MALGISGSYRGYTWSSLRDLSVQLGKSKTYVRMWLNKHDNKTVNDCIDDQLDNYESYRGYSWRSIADLERQLCVSESTIYNWLRRHADKTVHEYIDNFEDCYKEYKGYSWVDDRELSILLGKHKDYVRAWLRERPDKTAEDCIDYVLAAKAKKTNKEVYWMCGRCICRKCTKWDDCPICARCEKTEGKTEPRKSCDLFKEIEKLDRRAKII